MDPDIKNLADPATPAILGRVGVVAIGRNEGERLQKCLESVVSHVATTVYVDSGSTDQSVTMARGLGVEVVELDMTKRFTAARARNAGWLRLVSLTPDIQYVQFVDGDCEVVEGWLKCAVEHLEGDPKLAVVCGRRRERYPNDSIYNRFCDIEWDTPVGSAKWCGGDAMMRVTALREVDGYNDALIAGEEPELCVRLRSAGFHIQRIDHEMTLHDAAMNRFGQWWKRTVRAGYAFAEGTKLHGAPPENHFRREVRSALMWGIFVPAIALALAWPTRGWSLLLFLGYPVLWARIFRAVLPRIDRTKDALLYSFFLVLGKVPEVIGQLNFRWNSLFGKQRKLIEYK